MNPRQPNVVLVMCDEMRYDCAGFAAEDRCGFAAAARTPVLDRFATRGVTFDRAYCNSPVCSPARASWLTGLLPHAHHQLTNGAAARDGAFGCCLRADAVTLGDVLSEAGYRCGLIGPWHMGHDHRAQHGFDALWLEATHHRADDDPYDRYLDRLGLLGRYAEDRALKFFTPSTWEGRLDVPVRAARVPTEHQRTTWTIDRAIRFCRAEAEAGRPFFAFVSIKDPHPPIAPPPELLARFAIEQMPVPDSWDDPLTGKPRGQVSNRRRLGGRFGYHGCQNVIAHYLALIAHVDRQFGRLLDALDEWGIADDTLVVFISDHGEMMGELGLFAKSVMYEASVRVPWLVRCPALLPAGLRVTTPVSSVDLLPTILDLLELTGPSPLDGHSLAGDLRARRQPQARPVVAEHPALGVENLPEDPDRRLEVLAGSVMVRDGAWKYTRHRFDMDELYDLHHDPGEHANRAGDGGQRSRIDDMRRTIARALERTGPGPYAWCLES